MDIEAWLHSLGLQCYVKAFREHKVRPDVLPNLTADDLKEIGVGPVGDRRRLLDAIAELTADSGTEWSQVLPSAAARPSQPAEAERRQLTVLFCDLVGSTAMSARIDPEDLHHVMRIYQDACTAVLRRWDGHLAKYLGDGVLAYFGWPNAQEDDAERAVCAGLDLAERVARLETSTGSLAARVGIATGLVVVGDLIGEGAAQEEAVVGETPNLAARLEALAAPGTVAIAATTRKLIGGLFDLADLGTHTLKGFAEPMQVWRPLQPSPAKSRFAALRAGLLAPLIGRERELETLKRLLRKAEVGNGQIVATVGDPGVGKSRLLDAFLGSEITHDWRVLSCSCRPRTASTPWLPVVELVKGCFGIRNRDNRTSMAAKIETGLAAFDNALQLAQPALLALLDLPVDDPKWQELNPPQRRRRILDSVRGLLQLKSRDLPLIVMVEDLHWADSETLALLDTLVESLPTSQILLLLSYRPEFEHRWGRRTYYRQLQIDPLATHDAEQLLLALLGGDLSLVDLERDLIARTHGNPLFLEEAVRDLVETGALDGEPGAYCLTGKKGEVRLPETVQAILAARIDRLTPAAKKLLQRAAVIGHEVPQVILEAVADQTEEEVRECLTELKSAEILYEARVLPDAAFTFKHALTHEMAYGSLLRGTRRTLHRRIGEALEMNYPDRLAELAETLVEHFEQGQVWPQAARYALNAADKAKSRYAYQAAMQFATRAQSTAAKSPKLVQESIWAHVLLGDLASLVDDVEQANKNYDQALAKSNDPTERRWLASKRHDLRYATRDGAKIAYYVHGSGDETILFVTPSGYGLVTWQPIVERLCQEFRVITVDLRGTGRSDSLVRPYTDRDHALDIAAVVNAAGHRALVGVGVSAAPYMLVRAAIDDPGLFNKLVLVGGDLGSDAYPDDAYFPDLEVIEEALDRDDLEQVARIFVPIIISEPGTEELVEQRIRAYANMPKETLLNFYTVPHPTCAEFSELLKRLQIPTLVMHGTADKLTPIALGRQLADAIPKARFYAFEGRCHLPMITATQEFCAVLREFVRSGTVLIPTGVEPNEEQVDR